MKAEHEHHEHPKANPAKKHEENQLDQDKMENVFPDNMYNEIKRQSKVQVSDCESDSCSEGGDSAYGVNLFNNILIPQGKSLN